MTRYLLSMMLLCALQLAPQPHSAKGLEPLTKMLSSHQVQRVEVLRIPESVLTMVAVTPGNLRANPSYRIELDEGFDARIATLFEGVSLGQADNKSDLRWAVLFYDKNGRELSSVFVDQFGTKGVVDNEDVKFSTNMSKRLTNFVHELP